MNVKLEDPRNFIADNDSIRKYGGGGAHGFMSFPRILVRKNKTNSLIQDVNLSC